MSTAPFPEDDLPPPPRRPLPALAVALATGGLVGTTTGGGTGLLWVLGTLLLTLPFLLGLGLTSRWSERLSRRSGILPIGVLALAFVINLARGSSLAADGHDGRSAPEVAVGAWISESSFDDETLGRIGGELHGGSRWTARRWAIDSGSVRRGETVALLPGGRRFPVARGPVPAARSGREMERVLPDQIVRLAPSAGLGAPLVERLHALRSLVRERLRAVGQPSGSLACAVLLGDRSGLDGATTDLFVRTGTRHMLAVSGLHVGLFAACAIVPIVALFARFARRRRGPALDVPPRGEVALRLALLGAYVLLAGAGSPLTRAALALGVTWIAPHTAPRRTKDGLPHLPRRADALSVWGLALALESLANPGALGSLSLQLSYAATWGLIVGTSPIDRLLQDAWPTAGRALTHWRGRLAWPRVLARYVVTPLRCGIAASAAAALATMPTVWFHFGEWSPAGLVVTPLSLPLLAVLFLASVLHALIEADVSALVVEASSELWLAMLSACDAWPATPVVLPTRPWWWIALAVVATFVALPRPPRSLASPPRRARRWAALAWALVLAPSGPRPAGFELHALDVGSGTAVAFRGPGNDAWVFDAGSRDRSAVARAALAPLLRSWDPARVHVVLSHEDRDHWSALPWVLHRYRGRFVGPCPRGWPTGTREPDADLGEGTVVLERRGPLTVEAQRGTVWAGNEGSRSLRLGWNTADILLSGDAEDEGLARTLRAGGARGPLRLLLLPHHGSDSPYLGRLLDDAAAHEVWVSAGGRRPPAAAELERRGARYAWTARDGPLTLRLPPPRKNSVPPRAVPGTDPAGSRGSEPPIHGRSTSYREDPR